MFEFKSKTECFKVTVKIQQCIIYANTNTNIYTLLCFKSNFKKKCFNFE